MSSKKTSANYVIFVNDEFYDQMALSLEEIAKYAEEHDLTDGDTVNFYETTNELNFTVSRKLVMERA